MASKLEITALVYRERGILGVFERLLFRAGKTLERASMLVEEKIQSKLSPEERQLLARNETFRNRHAGKRCFVIGNGPSLKTQDLSPLKSEITFVMNAFWKHPIVESLQPSYYCFADPAWFDASEAVRQSFRSLLRSIRASTYFVPLYAANQVQTAALLPLDRTFYVATRGELAHSDFERIELASPIPSWMSVSQLCIMAAIYMGCSPIYLLGLDHDWLAHHGIERHFYEGNTIDNYFRAEGDPVKGSYKYYMECQLKLWNGYENLLDFARRNNIELLNATDGGFLDVFPRINYKNVVASPRGELA